MKRQRLRSWAKTQDISYWTALRMAHAGKLNIEISDTGRFFILLPEKTEASVDFVLYARVSSSDQKEDLARQLDRLRNYAAARGLNVVEEITEIGSGLNGKRNKLIKALKGSRNLLVEHRDRLTRFGFDYIEAALEASGRHILVINQTEEKKELVQDLVDVCTSLCAKIYGQRSARNRAQRMIVASEVD